nr:GAF domain-containing protein [Anaerolineae bacterium]
TFTEGDQQLCQALANQAAVAIENARLYAAEQQRRREAETLHRAAQALATTLDLHQVFERILSELQQVVPYDSASVQLLRDGHLEIIGGHGFPNLDELLGITFDLSKEDNPNREVIRRRASFIVEDAPAVYSRFREEPHAAAGIRAWLGVPLLFGDRLIGMLALDKREPGFYTSEHVRLAEAFAAQAAVAIENAHLYEEAQRRADELTRLHKAAVAVSSSLELSEVLGTLAKQVGCALDTSSAYICNLDEETGQSTVLAEWINPEATNHESDLGATYDLHRYPTTLRALQEKRPLVARATDPDLDPADRQSAERYGWKSYLIVPLVIRDRVIGYVELWETRREREFTEAEVRLCQTLAADAAAAIEHARLYEEARRYVEELTVLHTIDVAITSSLNLDEVLQRVYEQVSTVMDIAAFHIALYDEEKDELHLPIIVDQGKRLPPLTLKVEEESGLSGWVVRTQEPLWIEDWEKEQDTLPVKGIALGTPTRSLMVLPLIVRDKIVGVISAQSYEPYAFDEGHLRLFSGIASQVAIAVENARLFEETSRRLAETRLLQEVMQAAASTLDF